MQKEIIYASLVKQPWFFYKIVNKYIEFTETLIKSKCDQPLQLNAFQVENYDLQLIAPTCSYRTIEINSDIARYHMIGCCIEILIHLLNMNLNYSIKSEITVRVLEAFNLCNFRVKLKCLEYFLRFFQLNEICGEQISKTVVSILNGINLIPVQLLLWKTTEVVNEKEINDFFVIIPKLFNEMKYTSLEPDNETHNTIVNSMIYLLKNCEESTICDAVVKFLDTVFHQHPVNLEIGEEIRQLIPKLLKHPNCMSLLLFRVSNETNNLREQIWKEAYQMLCRDDFYDINKIEAVLKAIDYANCSSKHWYSKDNLSLQSIDNIFIDKIKEKLRSTNETTIQKLNIIRYLISGEDFVNFDETFKLEIFDILFNSFSNNNSSNESQIRSIEIISTLDSSKLDQKILDRISKILSTILTSDRTNDVVKNYLIEKSLNFLINRLYSTNEFLKNILTPAWNSNNHHRSLSSILDKIICLYCNEVEIIKIFKNGTIVYTINCKKCDSDLKLNRFGAVSVPYESVVADKTDLKDFVKSVLTLLGSDDKVIKKKMFKCLVNSFNHFGMNFDLELWTNLFLDADLEIRDDFSKIIPSIFKAIQVSFFFIFVNLTLFIDIKQSTFQRFIEVIAKISKHFSAFLPI